MGLFDFLWRLLGGGSKPAPPGSPAATHADPAPDSTVESAPRRAKQRAAPRTGPRPRRVKLDSLHYSSSLIPTPAARERTQGRPYRFACPTPQPGEYLDLSQDSDQRWLDYYGLPLLKTPDDLAAWLKAPVGRLAWLTHSAPSRGRAGAQRAEHYIRRWVKKTSGGWRLIEAPKPELRRVQGQILEGILNRVPAHLAAHGFVRGRNTLTNAQPHLGQRFILKLDLENFYATVRYSRVVAIYRSFGFSREVSIWLARLSTATVPWDLEGPVSERELEPYLARHLPQGAATSPALANLSAFGLDVRLSGLAGAYGLQYTRYADDLTFSGPGTAMPALRELIPLIQQIIRHERFRLNASKRRLLRNSQRQIVAGVVVNEKANIPRSQYDALKAILHNCRRHGPASQNRRRHADFAAHLRGRIAHVRHLNAARGEKLLKLYGQIDWSR
jgi:retron-type reverse transcriptase